MSRDLENTETGLSMVVVIEKAFLVKELMQKKTTPREQRLIYIIKSENSSLISSNAVSGEQQECLLMDRKRKLTH